MNAEIFNKEIKWHKSEQIINLLTMATEQNDSNLVYMKLTDFAKEKNNRSYLDRYVNLSGVIKKEAISISTIDDIETYLKDIQFFKIKEKERAEKQKQLQEEMKKREEYNNQWQIVQKTDNIQVVQSFINKYPDSEHIQEAQMILNKLKELEEQEKQKQLQEEIKQKWESIQKLDNNIKKQALINFIKKYPESEYKTEAQNQLKELETPKKTISDINQLKSVKDSRQFKKVLEDNKDNLHQYKDIIKCEAIRLYNSLKGKKQKNFFKEIQLARFLDKEFEDEVKNSI
jgi:TolA-binding protein